MPTSHPTPPRDASAAQTESQSAYWRAHHDAQPWAAGRAFADYEDAYRTGIEGRAGAGDGADRFDEAELRLRSNYETRPGSQVLGWDQGASLACRAAWERAAQWEHGDAAPRQTGR